MADSNTPNSLDAQASAPTPPVGPETPAVTIVTPGFWAGLSGKQKLAVVAAGSVIAAVGALYGAKQLTPPRVVAQSPPAVTDSGAKPEANDLTPAGKVPDLPPVKLPDLPSGKVPDIVPVKVPDTDIPLLPAAGHEVPTVTKTGRGPDILPVSGVADTGSPPLPGELPKKLREPEPTLVVPPKDSPRPGASDHTLPELPALPGIDRAKPDAAPALPDVPTLPEIKIKPTKPAEDDPFKSPARPGDGPVIRTGGTDSNPPPPPPLLPAIGEPPAVTAPKPGGTDIPKIDVMPLIPIPKSEGRDTPVLPDIKGPTDFPERRTSKETPETPLPKIEIRPAVQPDPVPPRIEVAPKIEVAPVAPAIKKNDYEEDWHTPEGGQTYVWISNFYYKTADYAKALEAYNRDRRKPGETIVRVPPTWVLEEKYGSGKDSKGLTFDKVEPAGATRPAPVAAVPTATRADEYKVADGGETIRDVAQRVYGDPNAWKKLYQMNPDLDPTQPIPAGTTLRVGK